MEDILGAIAGEQPSLGSDPAFANLAASMGNPQTAEILTRAGIVEDGSIDEVEKPEDWGELHQWETAGFGMEIEGDGTRNLIYALYYNDPDAGEADADELMRRMSDFSSEITDRLFGVGNPFEACEFSVSYAVHDEGSTTTVICKVEEDAQIIPPWMLVDTGDLGFLVP
jgi:hypothetical protein